MREPTARGDRRRSLSDEPDDEETAAAFAAAVKAPRVVVLVTVLATFAVLGVGGAVGISALYGSGGAPTAADLAESDAPVTSTTSPGGAGTPGTDAPTGGSGGSATPGSGQTPAPGAGGPGDASGEPRAGADDGADDGAGDAGAGDSGGPDAGGQGDGDGDSEGPDGAPASYGAETDLDTVPDPPAEWSAADRAEAEHWLEVQGAIARCMRDKGFDYEFLPYWMGGGRGELPPGRTARSDAPWLDALEGRQRSDRGRGADDRDANWRRAGCRGYAEYIVG